MRRRSRNITRPGPLPREINQNLPASLSNLVHPISNLETPLTAARFNGSLVACVSANRPLSSLTSLTTIIDTNCDINPTHADSDTGLHANYGFSRFVRPKYDIEDDRLPILGVENKFASVHSSGAPKRAGANNLASRSAYSTSTPRVLGSIGQTAAYLTRKFPPLSNKHRGKFTRLDKFNPRAMYGGTLELEGNTMPLRGWTRSKWVLVASVLTLFCSSLAALLVVNGFWFRLWPRSQLARVAHGIILLYATIASSCVLFASSVGLVGALLNSRPILTFYNILLWPSLLSTAIVGYSSYKSRVFNLSGKINELWTQSWGDYEKTLIQDALHCCGLYNPLHQAVLTSNCHPRSITPGCNIRLEHFEQVQLALFSRLAFAAVGLILASILAAVVCSNHVNRLFGKGLTPRQYRLKFDSWSISRGSG